MILYYFKIATQEFSSWCTANFYHPSSVNPEQLISTNYSFLSLFHFFRTLTHQKDAHQDISFILLLFIKTRHK